MSTSAPFTKSEACGICKGVTHSFGDVEECTTRPQLIFTMNSCQDFGMLTLPPSDLFMMLTLVLGVWILVPFLRYRVDLWRSRNWPNSPGVVRRGLVLRGGPTRFQAFIYRSLFVYDYEVGGSRYAGRFAIIASDSETAEKLQTQCNGISVTVQYNPSQPKDSFLRERDLIGKKILQNPLWIKG
jgi:hypothetical protein